MFKTNYKIRDYFNKNKNFSKNYVIPRFARNDKAKLYFTMIRWTLLPCSVAILNMNNPVPNCDRSI